MKERFSEGLHGDLVDQVPLLAGLGPFAADVIRRSAWVSTHKPREVIVREHDEGDELYVVANGYLKATSLLPDGRQMLLCLLGGGDVFGESSAFAEKARPSTVMALTKSTTVAIAGPALRELLDVSPALAARLLALLTSRVDCITRMYLAAVGLEASTRIAQTLHCLATRHGVRCGSDSIHLPIRISQRDLGEMVGVSRESVNKALRTWINAGHLRYEEGRITLVDPQHFELRESGLNAGVVGRKPRDTAPPMLPRPLLRARPSAHGSRTDAPASFLQSRARVTNS